MHHSQKHDSVVVAAVALGLVVVVPMVLVVVVVRCLVVVVVVAVVLLVVEAVVVAVDAVAVVAVCCEWHLTDHGVVVLAQSESAPRTAPKKQCES